MPPVTLTAARSMKIVFRFDVFLSISSGLAL